MRCVPPLTVDPGEVRLKRGELALHQPERLDGPVARQAGVDHLHLQTFVAEQALGDRGVGIVRVEARGASPERRSGAKAQAGYPSAGMPRDGPGVPRFVLTLLWQRRFGGRGRAG